MKEIKQFLSKILTAQSITKEIREEALKLRDLLDLQSDEVLTSIGIGYRYQANGQDTTIFLEEIERICDRARRGQFDGKLLKIYVIKEVRLQYNIGLKEAKKLTEWLAEKQLIKFTKPSRV